MANRRKRSTSDPANELASRISDAPVADEYDEDEQIRARAYELYMERGGIGGDELEDWIRAEREIRARPEKQARSSESEQGAS
jgi:hypothetical protein